MARKGSGSNSKPKLLMPRRFIQAENPETLERRAAERHDEATGAFNQGSKSNINGATERADGMIECDSSQVGMSSEQISGENNANPKPSCGDKGIMPASSSPTAMKLKSKEKAEEFPTLAAVKNLFTSKDRRSPIQRPFASLFKDNRNISRAEKLTFHSDVQKGKLKITKEVAAANVEWSATLIGVFTGHSIPFQIIRNFVRACWQIAEPRIYIKDNGVIIFKFQSLEDRDWVLSNGSWNLDGTRPLMLKAWKPGMPITWESFERIPLWVCLPDLDPTYFNNLVLSRIGSTIGQPVCMDECIANCTRMSYARLLIEVSAEESMIKEIELENDLGEKTMQQVVFKWLPWACKNCRKFGHVHEKCPKIKVENKEMGKVMWKPKYSSVVTASAQQGKRAEFVTMLSAVDEGTLPTATPDNIGDQICKIQETNKNMTDKAAVKTVHCAPASMTVKSVTGNLATEVRTVENLEEKNDRTIKGCDKGEWTSVIGKKAARVHSPRNDRGRGRQISQKEHQNRKFNLLSENTVMLNYLEEDMSDDSIGEGSLKISESSTHADLFNG